MVVLLLGPDCCTLLTDSDADSSTDRVIISLFIIADLVIGPGISLQNNVKSNGKKHQESPTLKKRANGVSQQQVRSSMLLHILFLNINLYLYCVTIYCLVER